MNDWYDFFISKEEVRLDGDVSFYGVFSEPNFGRCFLSELNFHYQKIQSREESKYTREHSMGNDLICLYYFFFNMELHYNSLLEIKNITSAHLYTL
ncbi:hypothetical protein [Planococcus plakortidis]|uniref:hypothetical protein n=1 Tax=Planococcus plakortidis TaxID=1038856 RepID=UPI003858F4EF